MRRLSSISIVWLIASLILVACGGGAKPEPTAKPAEAVAATQVPAATKTALTGQMQPATQAPATTTAAAPTQAAAPTADELPVLKAGSLKTYIAKIEFKTETIKPAPAVDSWGEMTMTYRLDPPPTAYSMVMVDKSEQAQPETKMIVIGKEVYFFSPEENKWRKFTSNEQMVGLGQLLTDPEEIAKDAPVDIFSAGNVVNRNERIDGVATTHYRPTEAQLRALLEKQQETIGGTQKLISGQADFWVANKGGYLKQYIVETTTEEEDGRQTKTAMTMLVTAENKPVTIEAPPADQVTEMGGFDQETPEPAPTPEPPSAETSAELARLPAPPRSKEYKPSELTGGAKFIVEVMAAQAPVRAFLSDASPEDVDAFYETEMPKLGYKSIMQQAGELGIALNMFMKGEQGVMIRINLDTDSGKTLVTMQMPD